MKLMLDAGTAVGLIAHRHCRCCHIVSHNPCEQNHKIHNRVDTLRPSGARDCSSLVFQGRVENDLDDHGCYVIGEEKYFERRKVGQSPAGKDQLAKIALGSASVENYQSGRAFLPSFVVFYRTRFCSEQVDVGSIKRG